MCQGNLEKKLPDCSPILKSLMTAYKYKMCNQNSGNENSHTSTTKEVNTNTLMKSR